MVRFPANLSCSLFQTEGAWAVYRGFYSAEARLVIELDGSQHYEDGNPEKDAVRTAFLEGYNLTVIRIPNNEISKNFYGVCELIDTAVKQSLSQLR